MQTAQKKRHAKAITLATAQDPVSEVARKYGVPPSMLFQWKRVMDDASKKGLKGNERVVPEIEVKKRDARIKELERALGRKTMQLEILEAAVELAREKN